MIVTINAIDDKKEKLLAVCNITVDSSNPKCSLNLKLS